jgi:hypothetical protein
VLNPPAPVPMPRLALGGRALEDAVRPSARSPYFNVLSPGGTIEPFPTTASPMSATASTGNSAEGFSRRSFVRAAAGGLAAAALPAARAAANPAAPAREAEPGLPFHAWSRTPTMGWNSWDSFGASVTEAEFLDNALVLAERFLPHGYDLATVDIQCSRAFDVPPHGARLVRCA